MKMKKEEVSQRRLTEMLVTILVINLIVLIAMAWSENAGAVIADIVWMVHIFIEVALFLLLSHIVEISKEKP